MVKTYFSVERMLHISTVKSFSSILYDFIQYILILILRSSFYYNEPITLNCDLFGYDRVLLENEVSPNFEKSGNVDINSKLNGKQACQACNYLLFFEDKEEN